MYVMKNLEMVDYRRFRLCRLDTPEFEHLKYLAYWPAFGLAFLALERFWVRERYYPMHCAWDDAIPFCEYFLIPYLFWFIFLVGMHVYTLLFEPESFKNMMRFIMLTYSVALLIYILFPNCQQLRPASFERDNIFTRFMPAWYQFDTNTNVCPSLHVIGSAAVMFCAWHSKRFGTAGWRAAFTLAALLISVSTVFLKQHSVIDVLMAALICLTAYFAVYKRRDRVPARVRRAALPQNKFI